MPLYVARGLLPNRRHADRPGAGRLNSIAYRFGFGPILEVWWEAQTCNAQPVQQVYDLGIVLLERLRSDSSLVTNETGVSQKKWDFARENAASLYVGMLAGGTQQTESCMDCRKRQGFLLCCQPPCLLWIHGTSYFRATMDSSTAHVQVMPST